MKYHPHIVDVELIRQVLYSMAIDINVTAKYFVEVEDGMKRDTRHVFDRLDGQSLYVLVL